MPLLLSPLLVGFYLASNDVLSRNRGRVWDPIVVFVPAALYSLVFVVIRRSRDTIANTQYLLLPVLRSTVRGGCFGTLFALLVIVVLIAGAYLKEPNPVLPGSVSVWLAVLAYLGLFLVPFVLIGMTVGSIAGVVMSNAGTLDKAQPHDV